MSGFASAQAAFERPPGDGPDSIECPDCEGSGETSDIIGLTSAGPVVQTEPCETCDGLGELDPRDTADWCDRCGLSGACPDCNPRERDDDR